MLVVQKSIFVENGTEGNIHIYIEQRSETIIREDKTTFISLSEEFIDEATFLIEQTKSLTQCIKKIESPVAPYRLIED